jgi:aryl-alcohol dehydrogenase-like predicted oxidoreductase
VGGRSAKQVDGMARALDYTLSEGEFARINRFLADNPV